MSLVEKSRKLVEGAVAGAVEIATSEGIVKIVSGTCEVLTEVVKAVPLLQPCAAILQGVLEVVKVLVCQLPLVATVASATCHRCAQAANQTFLTAMSVQAAIAHKEVITQLAGRAAYIQCLLAAAASGPGGGHTLLLRFIGDDGRGGELGIQMKKLEEVVEVCSPCLIFLCKVQRILTSVVMLERICCMSCCSVSRAVAGLPRYSLGRPT